MSLRAYGKHRGVSHEAVRQAIRDHRIVKGVTAEGKIIAEIADAEWERNTGPRPNERSRPSARAKIATAAGLTRQVAQQVASSPPISFGGSNYQLDRARRENVRLRKELIELRKLEEKFINADEAKVAHFNESRMLRDRVFNIRDRAAPLLAAETEQRKCWEILDTELRLAFGEYADGSLDEQLHPGEAVAEHSEANANTE
jgi:hypothetical protein